MKPNIILVAILFFTALITQATYARTVEIDVHGMTCAFCVDSLERKFGQMEHVSKVEVSLKNKKIRLETDDTLPTIEAIKQTVLDTGFTPVKVEITSDDKK